ncbi:MAG: UDPGP type 1 family protein, partial [Opitutaceae bacterium]
MSAATPAALLDQFRQAGQGQVFAFWERLSPAEQAELAAEAREVDLAEVARLSRTLLGSGGAGGPDLADLEPAPYEPRPESGGDAGAWARARA